MRKILVLAFALLMTATSAWAGDLESLQVAELEARDQGRAVVSDGSVILNLWYTGSTVNPQYTVSPNQVILYENGAVSSTVAGATYEDVTKMASQINSLANWDAKVGSDATPNTSTTMLLARTARAAATTEADASIVNLDSSRTWYLTAGVAAKLGKIPRIKSITHKIAFCRNSSLGISEGSVQLDLKVYADDDIIWRTNYTPDVYNQATSTQASPVTVNFGNEGISAPIGKSICVVASTSSVVFGGDTSVPAESRTQLAIVYDQF